MNPDFAPLYAQPNRRLTLVFRTFVIVLFGSIVISIYMVPVAFAMDRNFDIDNKPLMLTLSYSVLLLLSWLIVRSIRRLKGRAVTTLWVDGTGLHYQYANGNTAVIRYADLRKGNNPYDRDVYAKSTMEGPYILYVHWYDRTSGETGVRSVQFATDIAYSQFIGNQEALRAHFINGISIFRRDLDIEKGVYRNLYIDPVTKVFRRKEKTKTWTVALIVTIVVMVAIFFLVGVFR